MRLGIFGGSFDPVHFGHLLVAETCFEEAQLDELWFVPAATPPHKRHAALASGKQRLEMLELAIAGHHGWRVEGLEIERGGVSYTVDTLRAIHDQRPDDALFLLMGADTLADLPNWREPAAILQYATPLCVQRHGAPPPDYQAVAGLMSPARVKELQQYRIEMPIIELSATDLRRRARDGRSLRYRTPRAVEAYIATHHLYREST